MSRERLQSSAERWLRQARDDATASEALLEAGKYAPSCFWSQQSAEKALKSVWIVLDVDAWGHSVTRRATLTRWPNSRRARRTLKSEARALRHAYDIVTCAEQWMKDRS